MSLTRTLNRALTATTGLQVRRVPRPAPSRPAAPGARSEQPPGPAYRCPPPEDLPVERLLREPVFIISSVRSGSTLLRMMLGAHSRLHAPHELHIRHLRVDHGNAVARSATTALGLARGDLEHLLWDRVLHRELVRSGKDVIVEKTPGNAFVYRRLRDCWPDARFVFLLRHPESVARSWHESDPVKRPYEAAVAESLRYMEAVEAARAAGPGGHTVRYEDITAAPQEQMRRLCAFLGIDYEPGMLRYGRAGGGRLVRGLGDWRETIRTGEVRPGRPLPGPGEIAEALRPMCRTWGYL
ncbi:sulfotransferase [Streptomyces cyaneogriseus subsp. noncyanogenus]|uniref:Sulfotransferase n=1 Tax=Streptomyces cyaneogriseus subsp. noncyanogenus TaxID=477245 RepID=A0A0C5GII6_9ACTN|nr:sulfotransferase [Streptomyces cyaneogriseus]AJP04286.1 sulfotransferase [Streptomyces cyaneogriseus subsp. noncyanogenus]